MAHHDETMNPDRIPIPVPGTPCTPCNHIRNVDAQTAFHLQPVNLLGRHYWSQVAGYTVLSHRAMGI